MRLTVLTVPADDAELAGARLWSAGASAIEERDGRNGRTALVTVLAGDDAVSKDRLGALPADWELAFTDETGRNSDAWRDHARTIVVNDDLAIQPAWLPEAVVGDRTIVEIEPAGSFGLGDHPTTRLSADAAWQLTRPGDRVLDVGCGTGILSIVALLRGASAAVAIDVAEAAREATVDNAVRNAVGERIVASCTPLAEVADSFDLVFANILAPTLIALADDLARVTAPGGRLVVSGVLAGAHDHVLAALGEFDVVSTVDLEAWSCVSLVRSAR